MAGRGTAPAAAQGAGRLRGAPTAPPPAAPAGAGLGLWTGKDSKDLKDSKDSKDMLKTWELVLGPWCP